MSIFHLKFSKSPRSVLGIFTCFVAIVFAASACKGAPQNSQPSAIVQDGVFPVSIKNCGRTVTVKNKPLRGVALNQGAIESALSLGVEKQMVGTAYLDDKVADSLQPAYQSVPQLATKYPTQEQLAAAHPDLVTASYASAFSDKAVGSRDGLESKGIATYLDPFACTTDKVQVTWADVWGAVSDLGKLYGVGSRAHQIVSVQQDVLRAIEQDKAGADQKIFWWDSQTDKPFAGGNGGGPALTMNAVGAQNIFSDVNKGWDTVSWERVIAADPDVIVVADASWSTSQSKIDYLVNDPTLKNLRAVKNKKFVTLKFSQSTPGVTLIDGVKTVSDQLKALLK